MATLHDADHDAMFGSDLHVYSPKPSSMTDQQHPITPPEPPTAIGPEWQPCVKLPITVHVREQQPGETHSSTREGITPLRSDDLIIRGVQGEEYPIGRELFNQTYRMGATPPPEPPTDEEIKRLAEMLEFFDEVVLIRAALERWGQR